MPWVETPSLSFTARHEASQADDALAVLEDLEQQRARLEELLPRVPENVTVILHDSPVQLLFANPLLGGHAAIRLARGAPLHGGLVPHRARCTRSSAPALRDISAGPDSERALLLSPRRTYTALAIGTNNPLLPPPARPGRLSRLLRDGVAAGGRGAALLRPGAVPARGDRDAPARRPASGSRRARATPG